MQRVLIKQARADKALDHLRRNAAAAQIREHAPLIMPRDGQRKGLSLLRFAPARHGRVPRPAAVVQQKLHRLHKTLAAELLYKRDGVTTLSRGVPCPDTAVLDPQAVHLPCGVVAADTLDAVAEVFEQIRQIRITRRLDLLL